jgi:hypothetical protein
MYEILKQYETVGERILNVDELKELLGIDKNEYALFNNFRKWVLDVCKKALKEHTDIKFTYEPYGKKGKGGKIQSLKFNIEKNNDYVDQLTLDMFIEENKQEFDGVPENEKLFENERLEFFADMCNREFSEQEMQILYDILLDVVPHKAGSRLGEQDIEKANYIKKAYDELNYRATQTDISNRFAYLKSILENRGKGKDNK